MTIELLLLPFEGFENDQWSQSILRLCGFSGSYTYKLYKELKELTKKAREKNQLVPKDFTSYLSTIKEGYYKGENCYGKTKEDAYGKPLTFVFAKDLVELEKLHSNYYNDVESYINKERALATMAYIKTLPKNRRIALYWY